MNGYQESNTTQDSAQTAAQSTGKCRRAPIKRDLTQEEVRNLLDYNPETGELRWKNSGSGVRKSRMVGYTAIDGYIKIGIQGKIYQTHRIIWLWCHGYWPEHGLDHIDRDKSNNRLSNLREISQQCNMRNVNISVRNTSGVRGVARVKQSQVWVTTVRVNRKNLYLGSHKDFTEAVAHRLAAEQCLDWAGCDSSSSAYQYMQNYLKG